jgi:hypothetical protein
VYGVALLAAAVAASGVAAAAATGDGATAAALVEQVRSQSAATEAVASAAGQPNVVRAGGLLLGLGFGVVVGSAVRFVSWEG